MLQYWETLLTEQRKLDQFLQLSAEYETSQI